MADAPNETPAPRTVTDAELEMLIAWCEAQIPRQRELMQDAQQVVTIYATPTTRGSVIGPDSEEAQFRSECANNFWQLADLLRRQATALAQRDAELEREQLIAHGRRKMLRYVAFVLAGDETADAQMAADDAAAKLTALRAEVAALREAASRKWPMTWQDKPFYEWDQGDIANYVAGYWRHEYDALRAEVARLTRELALVDETLARRPALADLPTRHEKIERAIYFAKQSDVFRAEVAALREALEKTDVPIPEALAADVLDEIVAGIRAGRAMGHGAWAILNRTWRLLQPHLRADRAALLPPEETP